MAGTIVVDRLESDASYTSSINIASPVIVSNTFAFPAGSASAPAITPSGDTNTGIFFPAADTIAFSEGGVESMRIDSSGQVGIGVTPGAKLDVYNSAAAAVGNEVLRLRYTTATSSATGDLNFTNGSGTTLNKISSICTSGSTVDLGFSVYNSSVTEAMRVTAAGNFQMNSGYGSVATAYGCRAWVNFNGSSIVAIRGSGNVTSITDNGTGDYTINFTTAMPDANYAVMSNGAEVNTSGLGSIGLRLPTSPTTTTVRVGATDSAGGAFDMWQMHFAIFR
jgi:hypothetical protein